MESLDAIRAGFKILLDGLKSINSGEAAGTILQFLHKVSCVLVVLLDLCELLSNVSSKGLNIELSVVGAIIPVLGFELVKSFKENIMSAVEIKESIKIIESRNSEN